MATRRAGLWRIWTACALAAVLLRAAIPTGFMPQAVTASADRADPSIGFVGCVVCRGAHDAGADERRADRAGAPARPPQAERLCPYAALAHAAGFAPPPPAVIARAPQPTAARVRRPNPFRWRRAGPPPLAPVRRRARATPQEPETPHHS